MFSATRILNGIVAALLLPVSSFLILGTAIGTVMWWSGAQLALVPLLYVFDLFFRRRDSRSDMTCSIAWTLLFLLATLRSITRFSLDIPQEIGGPLFYLFTATVLCVLPLLLNGTYLVRLILQKRIDTQLPAA
ncbi:MAG: hypothetical protein A2845_03050 [Candidatus Lloydbacteria bacterium RIFCSPHIGHO2_01_FULL_49_22]|uniref:Uncharacterized protein n=1 Tax=Candidatus Lloydbacteria bacterium RIFCSPHIGHO2_01_FULL_49_22 TaxID=1798658 RepID=A0A1G2CV90_9BACT|nr:MAG: hypothetical protein A2845_03050 [Candidatus Lloydbacteria bacterium RIFCSPHIGHO2_01_FULL_49_22]OGZ10415.1 MAG: hypothetical protein A3C14_02745 [Candidatus Lloydbacteria bacterium RIFCSPHIGHO2_02_FULL_50_18]